MNLFPPNVTALDSSVQLGDSIAVSNLFEASDLDGNAITRFRFRDNSSANVTGFFTVAGVRQQSGAIFEVSASQLGSVRYQAGALESAETFSVQVFDGQFLSALVSGTISTVAANNFAPTITGAPGEVLSREVISASSLFSVSDPENDPIVRYFVVDRSTNASGGFFRLNGVAQESGSFFTVEANQLDQLEYVGGFSGQTENVAFQAFDGEFFSDVVDVPVTTLPNLFAPEVDLFTVNSALGRSIAAESLFRFSDQDGNTPTTIGFLDTGTQAGSGFFTVNGVQQAAGSFFTIAAEDIGTVRYNVPETPSSEEVRIFVTDGRFSSGVESATFSAIPRPKLAVNDFDLEGIEIPSQTLLLDSLETVNFSSLLSLDNLGPPLSTFQVIDQDLEGDVGAARLVLDGDQLQRGVVHTLTAAEFSSLEIQGGNPDDRTVNQFLVRGRNPLFFTPFEEFRVDTFPGFNGALTLAQISPDFSDGEKTVVTYAFIDGFDPFNPAVTTPPVPSYYPAASPFRDGAFPTNTAQRNSIREALDLIETYADLEFVEVPFDPDGTDYQITFGLTNGLGGGTLGAAFIPFSGNGLGNVESDVWFNRGFFPETDTAVDTAQGTQFFETALHEIGHALGLDHPFSGSGTIPIPLDNTDYSILASANGTATAGTYGVLDIFEVQRLYGANEEFNTGNDQYRLASSADFVSTLYDAGGRDTINLATSFADETINLNQGEFSTVNGLTRFTIAYGTQIENIRAGSGDDVLIGNAARNLLFGNFGEDVLEGEGGNDVLRGGALSDTYIYRTGDGRDRIDEQNLGGAADTIEIFDDTALSSLENDLVFRRFGNNLRIDLRFDRGQAQGSILIRNQGLAGSRVETLRLLDASGEQITPDIDLNSIFVQASSRAQFFELTSQQTDNGFIAVPT